MSKTNDFLNKLIVSLKNNLISWFAVALTIISIFRGLEFLTIVCLTFIWVRNDNEMGIRLRQIFSKIGKEGIEFREPPEEIVTAEKPELLTLPKGQADDFNKFKEANKLLSGGSFFEAEKQYLDLVASTSNRRIKTDSYINLGVIYMRLWHQTYNQEYLNKSIDSSRNALELDPEGYRSRLNLAVALSKDHKTEPEALVCFEGADERGDLRDPVLWGKIKLFKASLITTLSSRPKGEKYKDRLSKAEIDVLEALRLFEMMKNNPEVPWLTHEANSVMNLIKKKKEENA